MNSIFWSPMINYLRSSKVITNLKLEKASDSSGVLQSLLGVLHYSRFVYVVLLGKFTELNVLGHKSGNTINLWQSWRYQTELKGVTIRMSRIWFRISRGFGNWRMLNEHLMLLMVIRKLDSPSLAYHLSMCLKLGMFFGCVGDYGSWSVVRCCIRMEEKYPSWPPVGNHLSSWSMKLEWPYLCLHTVTTNVISDHKFNKPYFKIHPQHYCMTFEDSPFRELTTFFLPSFNFIWVNWGRKVTVKPAERQILTVVLSSISATFEQTATSWCVEIITLK